MCATIAGHYTADFAIFAGLQFVRYGWICCCGACFIHSQVIYAMEFAATHYFGPTNFNYRKSLSMPLFIGKLLPFIIIFRLHEKRLISMTLNPESLSKAFDAYTPARTKHINVRVCAVCWK